MINKNFWVNKKVFITGHTGFKGSWLCLWLTFMGAKVTGYALEPPTTPSLYSLCNVESNITSIKSDIRDRDRLQKALIDSKPDIIFHMAAQPLVRDSYIIPVRTYETNVMGTIYLLEGVRHAIKQGVQIKAVINVTTDKCYENYEWEWGYREIDRLGGFDPYSNSKACSEMVTSSYRNSFFNPKDYNQHGIGIATARAGNVIGGGDWADNRLVPDCVKALLKNETIKIRNPHSIRPWQHVLEPLSGYITLAELLYSNGERFSNAWNFGPEDSDARPVEWIVKALCQKWDNDAKYEVEKGPHPHEANYLKLDCSKAKLGLSWNPRWNLEQSLDKIIEWTKAYRDNESLTAVCYKQIKEYEDSEGMDIRGSISK